MGVPLKTFRYQTRSHYQNPSCRRGQQQKSYDYAKISSSPTRP